MFGCLLYLALTTMALAWEKIPLGPDVYKYINKQVVIAYTESRKSVPITIEGFVVIVYADNRDNFYLAIKKFSGDIITVPTINIIFVNELNNEQ